MPFTSKPFAVRTMNKISSKGLALFGEGYSISDEVDSPAAILVRSAKVDTDGYEGLIAVARAGAGTNNITIDKASEKGICVFNTPGANANAVSELVFTALGMAARNVPAAMVYAQSLKDIDDDAEINTKVEKGKSQFSGWEVAGKTMAVIGLGKIGVLAANGAVARGMTVRAFEPFPSVANMHQLAPEVEVSDNLGAVLAGADVVSVHVPLLDATRGIINGFALSQLNDGAVVLNFARGGIVDDEAMDSALNSGKASCYVTDFPNKFWLNHEKALCLPHLGASTGEAEENCANMAVSQMKDYLENGNVVNSVNFPTLVSQPAPGTKTRFVVITKDEPNMIANITKILGDADINIQSFKNESNGKIGYNLIDLGQEVTADLAEKMLSEASVLKVRVIAY